METVYLLLAQAGVISFAAMGSALGIGTAGMAAVGAWKKCYIQNKPAPLTLGAFIGAPLTQTIYALILMFMLGNEVQAGNLGHAFLGISGGIAMGLSAWFQGKAGANASDAYTETGKGFANYMLALGLVESVALFVMVFLLLILIL